MKINNPEQNFDVWIKKIAIVGDSRIPDDEGKIYYSKIDGSYITRVGLEEDLNFLLKRNITDLIQNYNNEKNHTANIGFNPKEKKWYGWSHRAIYGFGIGSRCKVGDCGYNKDKGEWEAKTLEDAKQMAIDFAKSVS